MVSILEREFGRQEGSESAEQIYPPVRSAEAVMEMAIKEK